MHYNIQIYVKKVEEAKPVTGPPGYPEPARERQVWDLLSVKVHAEDERKAYTKAATMLAAATPEFDSANGIVESVPFGR